MRKMVKGKILGARNTQYPSGVESSNRNMKLQKSKVDVIEERLTKMINSGALISGQWLKQQKLANMLDTSIIPLREALRRLEAFGLVVNAPYRGVRVSEISREEISQIYLAHALLQSEAARLYISKITNREIAEAHKLNDRMRECVRTGNYEKIKQLNQRMHLILCGASHFTFFGKLIRFLWRQFPRDVFLVLPDRAYISVQEHEEILAAFSNREPELASKRIKEHFISVRRSLTTYLYMTS